LEEDMNKNSRRSS